MSAVRGRSRWRTSSLGELASYTNGRAFKKDEWREQGLPIIRIQNLNDQAAAFNYSDAEHDSRYRVRHGDLLVSWAASLGAHIWRGGDAWVNQHIFRVEPREDVASKRYLFYVLKKSLPELYLKAHGSGMVHVTRGVFDAHPVPLPPREEQDEIVAELEKQFSRLDEAVANLQRVKANLKRHWAATLSAAIEGRLTDLDADRAAQAGHAFEDSSALLVRVRQARQAQWSARGALTVPVAPDTSALPTLPAGWGWATVEEVSDFVTKGTTPAPARLLEGQGDVQFLKVYNLTFDGSLNHRHKPAFVERATHEGELARSKVVTGDVLINIVGPPLGQVSVVPEYVAEANINQAIARIRPIEPMSARFVALALMCEDVMRWAIQRAKTTAGQSNLTLELVRALPLPIPPLTEQHRIVTEVDRRLSIVREVEAEVDANLKRAQALRQAVLARTFQGEAIGLD